MIATATDFFPDHDAMLARAVQESPAALPCSAPIAPSITILGIPFDNLTTAQTLNAIEEMVASRKPHYLATANVDFLVQSKHDIELRRILLEAHLVLCDGTPLVWASRLLGNPLPERVAGSDLVPLLIRIAEKKNYRVFFLGGSPHAAERAVANLQKQHPKLAVAGYYSPPFASLLEMNHDEIRRRIQEAKPDLLFVSFGCPKQEKWISMHYRSLGVPVCVGVGATIDFLAGKIKRAPRWMRKTGMEWIFRAMQEPRRLMGRYAKGLWWFSGAIIQQWWQMQLAGGKKGIVRQTPTPKGKYTWKTVRLPERLDIETVRRDAMLCEQALATSRYCMIDLSNVKFVDSTGIGLLVRLQKKARITGQQLVLIAPSQVVQSVLKLMRLHEFFVIARSISEARKLSEVANVADPVLLRQNYFPSKPALFWRGEITAANAERVWQMTQSHIASHSNAKESLKIDVSFLQFIDSTGVGLMLRVKKCAAARGSKVQFIGVRPNVKTVLRLSNLESVVLSPE
jgi:N-acetylglucosaminyldiphosphoundecaprenol N-acetyl-beta-D-mannosaminyltransferase